MQHSTAHHSTLFCYSAVQCSTAICDILHVRLMHLQHVVHFDRFSIPLACAWQCARSSNRRQIPPAQCKPIHKCSLALSTDMYVRLSWYVTIAVKQCLLQALRDQWHQTIHATEAAACTEHRMTYEQQCHAHIQGSFWEQQRVHDNCYMSVTHIIVSEPRLLQLKEVPDIEVHAVAALTNLMTPSSSTPRDSSVAISLA